MNMTAWRPLNRDQLHRALGIAQSVGKKFFAHEMEAIGERVCRKFG
jgi:hypothetical protein